MTWLLRVDLGGGEAGGWKREFSRSFKVVTFARGGRQAGRQEDEMELNCSTAAFVAQVLEQRVQVFN